MPKFFDFEFPYAGDKYHDPTWKPNIFGTRVPCVDAYEKVTGKAEFAGDWFFPDMLFGKVLRASVAHAKIKSIDTSKAAALPGVKAVITYKDRTDTAALELGGYGERFLVNKVRGWSDPVAAVAAETEEIAENALDLINVEYELLPVILEPSDALKTDATVINEKAFPKNVAFDTKYERGDIQKGFQEADQIFEGIYKSGNSYMLQPELHCAVARYENGHMTLWAPNQGLYGHKTQMSNALGIPSCNITIKHFHGGAGFASGVKQGWLGPVAGLLAMKTGKAVKVEDEIEREIVIAAAIPWSGISR